jgi:hypothetical protein
VVGSALQYTDISDYWVVQNFFIVYCCIEGQSKIDVYDEGQSAFGG